MKWINVLHLYQPPTQSKEIIDRVVRESYKTILSLLETYSDLRLTVNIAGSLLELLIKYGHQDIVDGFRKHAERGAIEFLGSAMYHPILPLLDSKEIRRQIKLHSDISQKYFGNAYKPRGFYCPEMAYNAHTGNVIKDAGFDWIILDEVHTLKPISAEKKYKIKDNNLYALFRNSKYSKTFPPESLITDFKSLKDTTVIICHDGELYGHWHTDDKGYYQKICTHKDIKSLTASTYLDDLCDEEIVPVRDANWESLPEELEKDIVLGLWQNPSNEIHTMLEQLKRDVLIFVEQHQSDFGYEQARHHADRGVASCAWWWASERKIGPFSPISWNPTEIEKGARELYTAIQSLHGIPHQDLKKFTQQFHALRKVVWQKHRNQYDPSYELLE